MFRKTDMVLICAMVAAAAFTYKTKHDAERVLAEARHIERQISFEEDTIAVLRADLSLLTQPARLQRLAGIYEADLELSPVEPAQIGEFSQLPPRPLEIEDLLRAQTATAGIPDPLTTGGVAP